MTYLIFKKDDDRPTTLVCGEKNLGGPAESQDGRSSGLEKVRKDRNERAVKIGVETIMLRVCSPF